MADAKTYFGTTLPEKITADTDKAKGIGAVFVFEIEGDEGGTWTVNLKDDLGVQEGDAGNGDCTLKMSSEDWETMSENPSAAMQLYFSGKLKVSGNAMLATKLQNFMS